MRMIMKTRSLCVNCLKNSYVKLTQKENFLDVRELFLSQCMDNSFCRFDIIIRYLFIEQFYGKNDYGYLLYDRMQKKRLQNYYKEDCVDHFKMIIKSYEEKGYDSNSKITIGNHMQLLDGSHRIALGLYFGEYSVHSIITKIRSDVDYSLEWFIANDFSKQEVDLLAEKYVELKNKYLHYFTAILWPPMENSFNTAQEDIKLLAEVCDSRDFSFQGDEFKNIIFGIYHIDDIESWKIQKKYESMICNPQEKYTIRMLKLKIENPNFRLKSSNCHSLSRRGEIIKWVIRTKYRDKIRCEYFYDNVLHIADNFNHSEYINNFLEFQLDLELYFRMIHDEKYALSKMETPYMPKDFPKSVPKGKDIDILCTLDSIENLCSYAIEFCKNTIKNDQYCIFKKKIDSKRIQVRIELNEFPLFIFDFTAGETELSADFISDAISNAVEKDGIKLLSPEYEVLYRVYCNNKKAKWYHSEYIKNHYELLDKSLVDKYHL